MQFALNYSPQAATLLSEGAIRIDRFKCPDWKELTDEARQYLPIYIHFDLAAGSGRLNEKADWRAVETALQKTDTPFVNLHLYPTTSDFKDIKDPTNLTEEQTDRVISAMWSDVEVTARRFGRERVIVENIPRKSTTHRSLQPCILPEIITSIVERVNCGFLLDISHARLTAGMLGIDWKTYTRALPLHRLRELHITGMRIVEGELEDHMEMQSDDWTAFHTVLGWIGEGVASEPWMVAYEYGGITNKFDWRSDPDFIARDVPQMVEAIKKVKERS